MKFIFVAALSLCLYHPVEAGMVITKKRVVTFGQVVKAEGGIKLKIIMGETVGYQFFKKSTILWYTTNKKVVNYYTAAKQAYIDKQYKVSKYLANQAIKNEPKNRQKAKELMMYIENLGKVKDPLEAEEDDFF